jgi:hypothetical protein
MESKKIATKFAGRERSSETQHPSGIGNRKRLERHRVIGRKRGGVHADAKGDRGNSNKSESGVVNQRTPSVTKVLQEVRYRVTTVLLKASRGAEQYQSMNSRIAWSSER